MTSRRVSLLTSMALAISVVAAPADAVVLAHESFTEANGIHDGTVSVIGTGSGPGWSGNWTDSGSGNGTATTFQANNSFTDGTTSVATSGGSAGFASGHDLRRNLDTTYTVGGGAGEHDTLWVSYLLDNQGPVSPGHEYRLRVMNGGTQVVSFGKEINGRWRLRDSDESVDFTTNITGSNLGNWLAVMRLDFDGTDTAVTGFLAKDTDAVDIRDVSTYDRIGGVTVDGSAVFDSFRMQSHNTSSARMDEIRTGETLNDVLGLTPASMPDVLALYTFEGNATASNDTHATSIASTFESQASGTQANEFGAFRTEDIDGSAPGTETSRAFAWSSRSANNASNSFFEFTITPDAGQILDMDYLELDAKVRSTLNGGTTEYDYDLFWDVDGFATAIGQLDGPSVSGPGDSSYVSLLFDLTNLSPQSGAVTFRLDPTSGIATNGVLSQRRGGIDNVKLFGSTQPIIPEPTTATLGLIGLAGLLVRRRRGA